MLISQMKPAAFKVDWAQCYRESLAKEEEAKEKCCEGHSEKQVTQPYNIDRDFPYKTIRVLLLSWKDDDLDFGVYIPYLKTVFGCIYNFPTYWFRIPSQSPKEFIEEKVEWFQAQCSDQRELSIVYYGGHGHFQGDNEMALAPYE
jgi:hypothetical protein